MCQVFNNLGKISMKNRFLRQMFSFYSHPIAINKDTIPYFYQSHVSWYGKGRERKAIHKPIFGPLPWFGPTTISYLFWRDGCNASPFSLFSLLDFKNETNMEWLWLIFVIDIEKKSSTSFFCWIFKFAEFPKLRWLDSTHTQRCQASNPTNRTHTFCHSWKIW